MLDVVIIGSGPGGYVCAIRCGQLGLKTAIVEKDASLGGTCLNRGCIPTKAWLHNATLFDSIKKAAKFGIIAKEVSLDFTLVQADKDKIVSKLSKGVEGLMRKNKVQVVKGKGGLQGPNTVVVTAADGSVTRLETKHVVLATGSEPRLIPGLQRVPGRILTSDELLEIEHVPKSMAVLGAGAVGCEFASVFVRYGTEVHLVEMLDRLVPLEDAELGKELEKLFKKRGIQCYTGHKAGNFQVHDKGVRFDITRADGTTTSLDVEVLLAAVGRGPVTDIPGLSSTRIQLDRGYVPVQDTSLRTAEPNIYAIGDIVKLPDRPHPQLAHLASAEGIYVAECLAGHPSRPINYDQVPSATYCDPEVASVGLSEEEARKRGYEVKIGKFPFSALSKATVEHENDGFVKYVSDAKYDELLGVHIIGLRATEMIAEAGMALRVESTSEEVFRTIHAHPTLSEAMAEAAHAVHGAPIHM